jgi:hypothetical protein
MINKNFQKFSKLRKDFPFFVYEGFEYQISEDSLEVVFHFSISKQYFFHPTISLKKNSQIDYHRIPKKQLNLLLFHIGMVEVISYWKTTCSPLIVIRNYHFTKEQEEWWKKLFYNGLSEFFYLNDIRVNQADIVDFRYETDRKTEAFSQVFDEQQVIVPVGGGKDSVVTIEHLKKHKKVFPLILNPRPASIATVEVSAVPIDRLIIIERSIDPELLKMNQAGFLNGHTPFSALLAFITLLSGSLSGIKNVALSNESSANEPTHLETNANHQYSKSYEFEKDFREYVQRYIVKDFNYFSFLRPLSEYQIAMLFAKQKQHFHTFKSCNVGSKKDIWCGKCSKCLFTYIILSPFVKASELQNIFGSNLLNDKELYPIFKELTGNTEAKPFECVGTIDEVNLALQTTIDNSQRPLPVLLEEYESTFLNHRMTQPDMELFTDNIHFLDREFEKILYEAIRNARKS